MALRRSIVQVAGQLQELPAGDTLLGGGTVFTRGTTTVDFGAWPGDGYKTVAITGQTTIGSASVVRALVRAVATADHTVDEHRVAPIRVFAGDVIAGVGFTISAYYSGLGLTYGLWNISWEWSDLWAFRS